MKRPSIASLKKVTAENLAGLGAERLAEILIDLAASRPDLKRRLRMELAAEQGAEHLIAEIDKRLASLQASRGRVSWRQRAAFLRDLDALRQLIAERLAELDSGGAIDRLWIFLELAPRLGLRVRDKDGELAAIFERAAKDLGGRLGADDTAASRLVEAVLTHPAGWGKWLGLVLGPAPSALADDALRLLSEQSRQIPNWAVIVRILADAAGNPDAYRSTFTDQALRSPQAAAGVARRMLAADRVDEAGMLLREAKPGRGEPRDGDWEDAWIEYLQRSGDENAAQDARWAAFERTLSVEAAREFTRRLPDFEDVEAEGRAFAYAAGHRDFERGLRFLIEWPALLDAAQMIQARVDEIDVDSEAAELWAARLRARHPAAAELLLRKAAAAAFRRRQFATSERLTQEADAIG